MEPVILIEGLVKPFGDTTALAGIDLVAGRGAVLGLLGPNGSGKTTTVRVLATPSCAPTQAALPSSATTSLPTPTPCAPASA